MTSDMHRPGFIRLGKPSVDKQEKNKKSVLLDSLHLLPWSRIIGLLVLLGILAGGLYLLGKLVTPQVLTALYVIVGFLLLYFVVKTILQVTFTLLRYLFWIAVLSAILLCVL